MKATHAHRGLAASLALLAVGVVTAAVLGPLVFEVIEFHLVDDVLNQVMGGDAVALILVAPAAAFAAWLLWQGHPAGPVVALAPAGYAMYTYTQLALGGEFATEPGNSERFFPLYLAIFVLAAASFVAAWNLVDPAALPTPTARLRRTVIGVLLTLSVFLTVGLHLPGLVDIVGGAPFEVEYTQSPTVFLIVKLMDLGIVVPVMVVTCRRVVAPGRVGQPADVRDGRLGRPARFGGGGHGGGDGRQRRPGRIDRNHRRLRDRGARPAHPGLQAFRSTVRTGIAARSRGAYGTRPPPSPGAGHGAAHRTGLTWP